tara:strand:- start:495 stop:710 length:216 start_codon:yes stop_codon:yes gene_type:complete
MTHTTVNAYWAAMVFRGCFVTTRATLPQPSSIFLFTAAEARSMSVCACSPSAILVETHANSRPFHCGRVRK